MPMWDLFTTHVQVSMEARRGQVPLRLGQLRVTMWMLGSELGSSTRVLRALPLHAFSRAPTVKGHSNRKRNRDNWSLCLQRHPAVPLSLFFPSLALRYLPACLPLYGRWLLLWVLCWLIFVSLGQTGVTRSPRLKSGPRQMSLWSFLRGIFLGANWCNTVTCPMVANTTWADRLSKDEQTEQAKESKPGSSVPPLSLV